MMRLAIGLECLDDVPDRDEEAEMEAALSRWRRHREMVLALARKDWTARAAQINAMPRRQKVIARHRNLASRSLLCC